MIFNELKLRTNLNGNMGLNDAHTIYGLLVGALFHSLDPHKASSLLVGLPPSLQSLLSVRFPRWQSTASLRRWAIAGAVLANLPGAQRRNFFVSHLSHGIWTRC